MGRSVARFGGIDRGYFLAVSVIAREAAGWSQI
jgi:hypothetical protein